MASAGALVRGERPAAGMPAREIRFRHVTFGYPTSGESVLAGFDLAIPAGSSLAIVGQNGAGKTTIAKLLCRLYDPQDGAIEVDGVDLRTLELDAWRSRLTAVFQDFVRFELSLRDNVAPAGAPDDVIEQALTEAGATGLAGLDTVLARGYPGGTDLSGGQWQRIALARALAQLREPLRVVSALARHSGQFGCRDRHAEETDRQSIKTLRIVKRDHCTLPEKARKLGINKRADLDDTSAHENWKKIMDHLFDMSSSDIDCRTKNVNQLKHGGQLNAKLKRTSHD